MDEDKRCSTCDKIKEDVKPRRPDLQDKEIATLMEYRSCDDCFAAVWAGAY